MPSSKNPKSPTKTKVLDNKNEVLDFWTAPSVMFLDYQKSYFYLLPKTSKISLSAHRSSTLYLRLSLKMFCTELLIPGRPAMNLRAYLEDQPGWQTVRC